MPFHNVTITDHYIFSWYIQSPCIPVASCLDNHRIITLIESTIFYQEVTGHFQIDSIIIVTVRFYIQIPGNTAITHVDMNSPKWAFPNFKPVKQYIPATVEMYQMRTKIVFSHRHLPFLYGNIRRGHRIELFQCIQNVAITGKGMLKPKMDTWKVWFARPEAHLNALKELYTMASTDVPVEKRQMAVGENNLRPHLIHFNRCRNVLLDGFKIRESPFWTIHIYMCNGGIARNLDVKAHGHNNDGIDLEMTRNFLVEDCTFDQGDDAVVIKAGRNRDAWRLNIPTENIVIRNCNIVEGHTLLGIGSEISGGIRNVYMHDCKVPQSVRRLFFVKTNHRRGAFVENIHMENIRAGHVQRVLEIDTDVLYQWKDLVPTYEERITRIDGIYMKNVVCTSNT